MIHWHHTEMHFIFQKKIMEKTGCILQEILLDCNQKSTKLAIDQELNDWAKLGVEGHFEAKNPWMPYHEFLTESMG